MNNKINSDKLTEKDKEDINEVMKQEPESVVEVTEEETKSVTVRNHERSVSTGFTGVPIEGLQDVPMSMVAVPFVKLVQPVSTKIDLKDGKEAPVGSFYFTDIQEAFTDLTFVILRVKHQIKDFEREDNGVKRIVPTKQLLILGYAPDADKLFILTLSVMSFSNFGRTIAQFKDLKVKAAWEYKVTASSEKTENSKGKFYIANFKIGDKLTEEEIIQMQSKYGEYGGVLDREDLQEEDA